MSYLTRRAFLGTSAAIPFAVWFERVGHAQDSLVRPDVMSPAGQAALKTYAAAVTNMLAAAEASPVGWVFQWYTHAVRADRLKAGELNRIYPSSSPAKDLAQAVWDTCQAHRDSSQQPFFLPWHRMYLYFFERIIRKVSGDTHFVLPYWNYSALDSTLHGILPLAFRKQNDHVLKSLFRPDRNRPSVTVQRPNVNGGEPIDKFAPSALTLAALKQGSYLPLGALTGFNQGIDGGLHGNVHVLVGNTSNMGSVPWAARDPIFWLHHCNVDRLWASWNQNGGKNPTGNWLTKTFVFADENGTRVEATVDDFKDIATRGYQYDRLEPAPPGFTPIGAQPMAAPSAPPSAVFGTSGALSLGVGATTATLAARGIGATPTPMTERAKALSANRRAYLVLRNLSADSQPGVVYNIYLNLPNGAQGAGANPHLAGTMSFFDAIARLHGGSANEKFVSFDITEILRDLLARQLLTAAPSVTIAPIGAPAADAKPIIGEISVVEQ